MAGMIRRAFPSVVRLPTMAVVRPIGCYSTTLNRTISASPERDGSVSQCQIDASGMDMVDARLYKLLKNEMKSVKVNLNNSQVSTLPDSFPYQIAEFYQPYDYRNLVLQRKFRGDAETITVIIDMRNVGTFSNGINSEDNMMSKKDIKAPAIPMSVKVQKHGKTDHLNFQLIVSTEGIIIESLSKDQPYGVLTIGQLDVRKFEEFDIEVQQALYKYLEIRGIDSSIVGFLLKYIAVENNKYYLHVLKDFVEFIEN